MANNKINFWMVAFFCLVGLFIGVAVTYLVLRYLPEQKPSVAAGPTDAEAETKKYYSFTLEGYGALGGDGSDVTVVEFGDYQCPACAAFHKEIFPQLKEKYIDTNKIKFVAKDFPLFSIHPKAEIAAETAHCAQEQGKFWEMHDLLFDKQAVWSASNDIEKTFAGFASELNLDSNKFKNCLKDKKYQEIIADSWKEAVDAGSEGTPTFFINGEKTFFGVYPIESFDAALNKAGVK